MTERTIEARVAMKGTVDPLAMNGILRRLLKGLKFDIEAGEIFAKWLDGKVSLYREIENNLV
jgi:hypothetical protein